MMSFSITKYSEVSYHGTNPAETLPAFLFSEIFSMECVQHITLRLMMSEFTRIKEVVYMCNYEHKT